MAPMPAQSEEPWGGDGHRSWSPKTIAAAAVAVVLLALGLVQWRGLVGGGQPVELRIATGAPGGTYEPLGAGLAVVFSRELEHVDARAVRTAGSGENMQLLASGAVELALVQNDTRGHGRVRTLARLYDEILHVVVRTDATSPIESAFDLAGRRIAVGAPGSGTETVALRVLEHFGLGSGDYEALRLDAHDAVAAFRAGELDAVFLLSALGYATADELCRSAKGRLLPLGAEPGAGSAADAIAQVVPFFAARSIPAHAYGREPAEPIASIAVPALLVCRSDLEAALARELVATLFAHKMVLAEHHSLAARFDDSGDPGAVHFPYHEGALAYYRRDRPSFLVAYADVLSFLFTLAIAVSSALVACREWVRRRKKNRIDDYYIALNEIAQRVPEASPQALRSLRKQLHGMRRRAFEELVAERIEADESFTIFQDFLRSELRAVESRMHEHEPLLSPEKVS